MPPLLVAPLLVAALVLAALFVVALLTAGAAVAAEPPSPDGLTHEQSYAAGKRAMDLGRYEEALTRFKAAAAASPKEALYHYNVGEALAALGKDR